MGISKPKFGQILSFKKSSLYNRAHCLIFDKKLSNAMDMPENFYKNSITLAEIVKKSRMFGSCIHKIDILQNHQVALLIIKVENKCKSKDISTKALLPVVSGVSRNQKLPTKD